MNFVQYIESSAKSAGIAPRYDGTETSYDVTFAGVNLSVVFDSVNGERRPNVLSKELFARDKYINDLEFNRAASATLDVELVVDGDKARVVWKVPFGRKSTDEWSAAMFKYAYLVQRAHQYIGNK